MTDEQRLIKAVYGGRLTPEKERLVARINEVLPEATNIDLQLGVPAIRFNLGTTRYRVSTMGYVEMVDNGALIVNDASRAVEDKIRMAPVPTKSSVPEDYMSDGPWQGF